MNLKEIKAMDPEDAAVMLRIELTGGKAWGGQLYHDWQTDHLTLCGKELTRHRYGYYQSARRRCERCAVLRAALKEQAEGGEDAG